MPHSPPRLRPRRPPRKRKGSTERGYDRRWQRYRLAFLAENPWCVDCEEPATEVDHEVPHRGDQVLFWDPANHRARCKPCHSRKTGRGR